MRIVELQSLPANRRVESFGSVGFDMLGFIPSGRVSLVRLEAGGRIGRHTAPMAQLLVIVSGTADVASGTETACLEPGDGVLFDSGEDHETTTRVGFTAIVIESSDTSRLNPAGLDQRAQHRS